MTLSAHSMQYLNQQGGLLTFVEIDDSGVANAYKLVPVTCWHNSQKFPHDIEKDIRNEGFRRVTKEGLEYFLVPETTTNAQGRVAQYAIGEPPPPTIHNAKAPPAAEKYLKAEKRKITRLG